MDNLVNVILSPIAPLTTSKILHLPSNTPLSSLPVQIFSVLPFPNLHPSELVIRHNSRFLSPSQSLSTLQNAPSDTIFLTLTFRLRGGKGGFGSQLRAQGGRMASRKRGPQDKSASRDLSGRRLKAVQDAKDLAEYIAKQPMRERAAREEKRRKLEGVLALQPGQGVKMEDHGYWEDKERLVEGVKSAVRDAVRAAKKDGAKVEVVHTVSVRGGGVKRDIKFAGFEEEYEDSSEDEEEDVEEEDVEEEEEDVEEEEEDGDDEEVEEDGEEEEDEEGEYEGSTEEEQPEDIKGKGKAKE